MNRERMGMETGRQRKKTSGSNAVGYIETLLEVPNDTVLLSNPAYVEPERLDHVSGMMELNHSNVLIKLHPTKAYLSTDIVKELNCCYSNHNEVLHKEGDRLRVKIHPKSKFAKMRKKQRRYDEVTERDGIKKYCIEGCSACCNTLFYITENEFLYIVAWLIMQGKVDKLPIAYMNAVRQAYYVAENYPLLAESIHDDYTALQKRFYNLGETVILLESCPFLDEEGKCVCYDGRPNICRRYGITDSCMRRMKPEHPSYNEILMDNLFLSKNSEYFMRQARPIYFFVQKYLSPDTVQSTVDLAQMFVTKSESDFFEIVKDDTYFRFTNKGGNICPWGKV